MTTKKCRIYAACGVSQTPNYREYLKGDMVRAKKYFYVLRPILACRWILENGTTPPMLFSELLASQLPERLHNDVNKLLELKMNSPEIKEIPRIENINKYIDSSLVEIKNILQSIDERKSLDWKELNELFLKEIN